MVVLFSDEARTHRELKKFFGEGRYFFLGGPGGERVSSHNYRGCAVRLVCMTTPVKIIHRRREREDSSHEIAVTLGSCT